MQQKFANAIGLLLGLSIPIVALRASFDGSETYRGEGDVVSVEEPALRITISHDDIPGLMPAMTMAFPVRSATVLAGLVAGTRVRFDLLRTGHALLVTRLTPIAAAQGGRPGFHDHTPHHGGVVAMWGTIHLEVVASPDGRLRIYLTDVWRRPLPATDWTGSVTLDLPDGKHALPFEAHDDALTANAPALTVPEVLAHVRITQGGEVIELHVLLPLHADMVGAALAVNPECIPPAASPSTDVRTPRCTVAFPNSITALAATRDGATVLIAVAGTGVTAWRMPETTLVLGLAAPPPIVVSPEHAPHGEVVSSIAVRPDGREAVVAIVQRLLRYSLVSGRLGRELRGPGGAVRRVAWSPDGARLLVTAFGDAAAHLVEAQDGHEVERVPLDGEATDVAFAADGHWAAIGSEAGPITLLDLVAGGPPRVLAEPRLPTASLAFARGRLLAAGREGLLRLWDAATGSLLTQLDTGSPALSLAVAPNGRIVAIAGLDWTIRLYDVTTGSLVETLVFHRAAVYGLAWAGESLLSGDNEGHVAVWSLGDYLRQTGDGLRLR